MARTIGPARWPIWAETIERDCPSCGEPATDVRHGRELEIEAIEIEDPEEVKQ